MAAHILIVDDHETVRRGLRSLLASRPEWHICGEATDGIQGVEKAKSLRPALVLMDISMPRMNGLEATRILRRELPEIKVVIISQNDRDVARLQAQEVDASAYVAKGDLSEELISTLDRLFQEQNSRGDENFQPALVSLTPNQPEQPGRLASHDFSQVYNTRPETQETTPLPWLHGSGEMVGLIRAKRWSETSMGPVEKWSPALRMMVSFLLANRFPLLLWWGPQYVSLYNDAYRPILGTKHPRALGLPVSECWSEIWHILQPLIDTPFHGGPATWMEDLELELRRSGFTEETHFTVAYSPVPDATAPGGIGGVLATVHEITQKIVSERRVAILADLSARATKAKTAEQACTVAAAVLAEHSKDVPFALLYLIDRKNNKAKLAGTAGTFRNEAISPLWIDFDKPSSGTFEWPLSDAIRSAQVTVVEDLQAHFERVPLGPWSEPPHSAVLVPIRSNQEHDLAGVLVAGLSSRLAFDSLYRSFLELVAAQIAAAIASARAYEDERKRAEALAEIDRAKTLFFSNVSHEFRTPLTLMLGPVEDLLAKSHAGLSRAAKSQLELVNRNGSRLLRLVNTLLDFSRIEAGRMQAIYQATDLAAFTVELASVFRSATEKAGLQLELDCTKFTEPVFVDRGMWEKIVLNLISNAFKFTFEGSITVTLAKAGNDAELRVRDTGVGIPVKELPRLFDRFHRIENTRSRTHEGSGIGLALVQELVKLHGGSVRAESTIGEGSTFIVSLPLGSAHLPPDRIGGTRTLASTAVGAAPFVEEALRWLPDASDSEIADEILPAHELLPIPCPPLPNYRAQSAKRPVILVADDNADMRQYLVRLLAERYEVQSAPDGQAALALVRERLPELILSDVMMPNLDGFGLLHELRSDPKTRTIPIILLSARAGEESRVEGMEHGADDYLIKPFSARELLARVQTHLEMARVHKQSEEALRRRTEQFETLLNQAPLGVYLVDGDLRIRSMNPLAHRFFGNVGDLGGRDFAEVIHLLRPKSYADEIIRRFRHTLETGEPYMVAERTLERQETGARETYEWQISRIPLPENGYGVVCYFRDITRQVEARERERQMTAEAVAATAKFQAVFEQTTVFAGIMALDGVIIEANRMCLDACGYRSEDVIGKHFWDCGWWQNFPEAQEKIRAATPLAAQGTPYRENLRYSWADGSEHLVDFALYPIRDHEGHILFLHPTGVDITEIKRAEEKYRELAETLDAEVRVRTSEVVQQSEQLRDLSSRLLQAQDEERRHIARELHDSAGQILTALGMTLAEAARHAPRRAHGLAKPMEESQHLVQQLSQEIRTMSYLLHPPLLDETGLSEALRWYIQGLSERSGLEITLEVAPDFKRLSREMELVMFRLVQECLTNIHRHSGSTSAVIRVARDHANVSLEVQDKGKGISAEKLSEMQSQGSGVGIRGMRERARHFGGHMMIESNHKGTKIAFKFPLSKDVASEPDDAAHPEKTVQPA